MLGEIFPNYFQHSSIQSGYPNRQCLLFFMVFKYFDMQSNKTNSNVSLKFTVLHLLLSCQLYFLLHVFRDTMQERCVQQDPMNIVMANLFLLR